MAFSFSFKTQQIPNRLFTELAVFVTLLLHVVILTTFRISATAKPDDVQKQEPDCFLLPPREYKSFRWEKKLWWWTRMKDPAVLARPDEEVGFSSVRTAPLSWPYTAPSSYRFTSEITSEPTFGDIKLVRRSLTLADKIGASLPIVDVNVPRIPTNLNISRDVVWRESDGRILPSSPSFEGGREKVDKLIREASLKSPTRLEIIRANGFIRTRIRESSGSPELDQLALKALKRELREVTENVPGSVGTEKKPFYVPEKGGEKRLEVEWRLINLTSSDSESDSE